MRVYVCMCVCVSACAQGVASSKEKHRKRGRGGKSGREWRNLKLYGGRNTYNVRNDCWERSNW